MSSRVDRTASYYDVPMHITTATSPASHTLPRASTDNAPFLPKPIPPVAAELPAVVPSVEESVAPAPVGIVTVPYSVVRSTGGEYPTDTLVPVTPVVKVFGKVALPLVKRTVVEAVRGVVAVPVKVKVGAKAHGAERVVVAASGR